MRRKPRYQEKREQGLVPFRYSAEYRRWADAMSRNDVEEARIAAEAHRRRFNNPSRD